MTGRIEELWSKRAHRGPMDSVREATLVAGQGMQGSVGRSRRRQVTILSREAWDSATAALGRERPFHDAVLQRVVADDDEHPIGAQQVHGALRARARTSSSALTAMRSAWKVRVAGWMRLWRPV